MRKPDNMDKMTWERRKQEVQKLHLNSGVSTWSLAVIFDMPLKYVRQLCADHRLDNYRMR